jgi:Flp pilus assembly protein TadG
MRSRQSGQSLIEFALLLPVFLLFAVIVFDLGRAVYYYSAVHNAAREGARYGAVHPNDYAGMKATAVNYAIGLGLVAANVTAGPGTSQIVGGFPNPTVKVTVIYSFSPATPLLERFLPGGTISLRGEAVMRTESLPSP